MKNCLATLLGGLLCQAAAAQCLPAAGTLTNRLDDWLGAAADPGNGLWLATLALMAGIAWRRQDH